MNSRSYTSGRQKEIKEPEAKPTTPDTSKSHFNPLLEGHRSGTQISDQSSSRDNTNRQQQPQYRQRSNTTTGIRSPFEGKATDTIDSGASSSQSRPFLPQRSATSSTQKMENTRPSTWNKLKNSMDAAIRRPFTYDRRPDPNPIRAQEKIVWEKTPSPEKMREDLVKIVESYQAQHGTLQAEINSAKEQLKVQDRQYATLVAGENSRGGAWSDGGGGFATEVADSRNKAESTRDSVRDMEQRLGDLVKRHNDAVDAAKTPKRTEAYIKKNVIEVRKAETKAQLEALKGDFQTLMRDNTEAVKQLSPQDQRNFRTNTNHLQAELTFAYADPVNRAERMTHIRQFMDTTPRPTQTVERYRQNEIQSNAAQTGVSVAAFDNVIYVRPSEQITPAFQPVQGSVVRINTSTGEIRRDR